MAKTSDALGECVVGWGGGSMDDERHRTVDDKCHGQLCICEGRRRCGGGGVGGLDQREGGARHGDHVFWDSLEGAYFIVLLGASHSLTFVWVGSRPWVF